MTGAPAAVPAASGAASASAGPRVLRVGTRGSALAVAQTTMVAERLSELSGLPYEIVRVTTTGDTSRASLSSLGGTGVFATELREALLQGECDVIVHSLKDLPTAKAPGLEIGAHPVREDQRDALCSAGGAGGLGLLALPAGARVGTGSPRRVAQLRSVRPDLDIRDIRGNIDTRLGFVTSGELDAVVLAVAGLTRLGRTDAITERIDLERFPGAPGQGCLAVEIREGEVVPGVAELDDPVARATATAERRILARLEAGCAAPVGATAEYHQGQWRIWAGVYTLDGRTALTSRREVRVDDGSVLARIAEDTADAVTGDLFDQGAAQLIAH